MNLVKSSVKSLIKSLVALYFDLVTENYYSDADQSSYNAVELFFSFL